jgi:hypothetical protein
MSDITLHCKLSCSMLLPKHVALLEHNGLILQASGFGSRSFCVPLFNETTFEWDAALSWVSIIGLSACRKGIPSAESNCSSSFSMLAEMFCKIVSIPITRSSK